jgi:hypothetical protein
MFWTLVISGSIVTLVLLYFIYIYFVSKIEVKAQPREPMYECERHGVFRKQHLITFKYDTMKEPYEQCPLCFNEKMKGPLDGTVFG